jgi:hypothetical protein
MINPSKAVISARPFRSSTLERVPAPTLILLTFLAQTVAFGTVHPTAIIIRPKMPGLGHQVCGK